MSENNISTNIPIFIYSLVLKRLQRLSKQTHDQNCCDMNTFWQVKLRKGTSTGGQNTIKYCNWRCKRKKCGGQFPPSLYVKRGPELV